MTTYADYYQRAIAAGTPGVKLVLGPTGLGKTSGIPPVVRANPDRKFIYLANRKQLLEQLAQEFAPGECVILRRDLEIVQQALTTHRQEFDALLGAPPFREGLRAAYERTHLDLLDSVAIRRTCDQLLDCDLGNSHLPSFLEEHAADLARRLLTAFRTVLSTARTSTTESARYRALADHPIIELLFPAIPFHRRPEVRIILMTLQKAYYGFYDGVQTRNLSDLTSDTRTVLFLDEFDFLENELATMICSAPQIDDPFDFVAHFYRAMKRHKLPYPGFPDPADENIRRRIQDIVDLVEEVQQAGLVFPDINQFTRVRDSDGGEQTGNQPGRHKRSPAIFRTRHAVSTSPLYLQPTERSFQLESRRTDLSWPPATWFFSKVGAAATRILTLFKELQRDRETYYWEMLRHCFRNTDFAEQVGVIAQFPHQTHDVGGPRGELLDSGYSLFDIDELQQLTDSEEVAVTYYQMLQTPENLLRALARKHLVFGLSATADLRRCVHHFDLDWLEDQGLLLPPTVEDESDIAAMTAAKATLRGGHMVLAEREVDGLDAADPDQAAVQRFLDAVARDDEFGPDTAGAHRSRRMHLFFGALHEVLTAGGDRPRLLLFLNTFRQVQLLFTQYATYGAEAQVYRVEPLAEKRWFDAFRLTVWGLRATVVFFNAALATEVRQNTAADAEFRSLFYTDDPVIVVTQYLSAGNGVNLTYKDSEGGAERDFTHIALLEAPYYFFSKPDEEMTPQEAFAGRKANVWYQAKLFYARQISERRFKQVLATMAHPYEWNLHYRTGSTARDCVVNQMAIYIQALGRIERTRTPTPDQVVLFAPEVFRTFQAFVGPEYQPLRAAHAPYASTNLVTLFHAVEARARVHEREARVTRDERLRRDNERSREAIHRLVARLEAVRRHGADPEARRDWEMLRHAVLRHDFHADVVKTYQCATATPYLSRGQLTLTAELEALPRHVLQPDSHVVHLDGLYSVVTENLTVRDHFLRYGYDLRFDHPGPELFTPYCLQAILSGAIGEEAIRALLEYEGLAVEALPDALFEVVDMRLVRLPWYIDAKNYSEQTLERFALPMGDPLWHPTLNDETFTTHACEKLARIRRVAAPESKLVYINLVSSQPRSLRCFDAQFDPVPAARLDAAAIVVVQGALDRAAPNRYQEAFDVFLLEAKRLAGLHDKGETDGTPAQEAGYRDEPEE